MRLIINGDDFGLTPKYSREIINCFEKGVLSSTSVLSNITTDEEFYNLKISGLKSGIHLNLTSGKPFSSKDEIPSLVKDDSFHNGYSFYLNYYMGRIRLKEIEKEWSRQIEYYLSKDLTPTHLDTHLHTHILPGIFRVITGLAETYSIKCIRNPFSAEMDHQFYNPDPRNLVKFLLLKSYNKKCTDHLRKHNLKHSDRIIGFFRFDSENILNMIDKFSEKEMIIEFLTHPGESSIDPMNRFLTSDKTNQFLEQKGVTVSDFEIFNQEEAGN